MFPSGASLMISRTWPWVGALVAMVMTVMGTPFPMKSINKNNLLIQKKSVNEAYNSLPFVVLFTRTYRTSWSTTVLALPLAVWTLVSFIEALLFTYFWVLGTLGYFFNSVWKDKEMKNATGYFWGFFAIILHWNNFFTLWLAKLLTYF